MRHLNVHIEGSIAEDRLLATMFDVVSPDGTLLAQGTASPTHPALVELPDSDVKRVHVIGYSPSGRKAEEARDVGAEPVDVFLYVANTPHEWLQWVAPFRSLGHLRKDPSRALSLERQIGRVWMTLWQLQDGQWSARPAVSSGTLRDDGIRQIYLDAPDVPSLLQVGGDEVAWRLISLPPGGPVRVALTRRSIEDENQDSVEVTVGRVRPMNELIMSYLSRGAAVEAARLGAAWDSADLALYEKTRDPISAAAGAYLLLKMGRLDNRRSWVENLVNWFPNMADGAIVAAALALQRSEPSEKVVRNYLDLAVNRGVPVFSLGISILVETMAAVHRGAKETKKFRSAYQVARAYNQARASGGAYFAFYGKSPAQPSWLRYQGPPDAPVADQDDVARSNLGFSSNVRLDLDAAGDSRQARSDKLDLSPLALEQLDRRGDAPFDPNLAQFDVALEAERSVPGLALAPQAGSWMDQRHAFSVFEGND
jgi:hypothetical protein